MRTRIRMEWRYLVALVACGLAGSAAWAEEAAPPGGGPCERLVEANILALQGTGFTAFQAALQAHRTTAMLLGALGDQLPGKGRWREGEPHWEEAYALLAPGVKAHLATVEAWELRYQREALPPRLAPATCTKHFGILASKAGALAQRIKVGRETLGMMAQVEKMFPTPARLKAQAGDVSAHLAAEAALEQGPEARAEKGRLAAAQKELKGFERAYAEAVRGLGDPPDAAQQRQANRAFGQALITRQRERLVEIIDRFKAANPG